MTLEQDIIDKATAWTREPFDIHTRETTLALLKEGNDELSDAFYKDLDFGTGGLRGVMGTGTNRVNKYTLGLATQGLANYLKQQFTGEIKVAIAHDCRNNSQAFSKMVAEVLAANGIKVLLFEDLRPTPELSFAIRHYDCQSGIVITASHNPPEYNGYKVYWEDGGQLVPPHDKGVIEEVRKVKIEDLIFNGNSDLIEILGHETDEAFLQKVQALSLEGDEKKELKIVFTPIHGTSITLLPAALNNAGFKDVNIIFEQASPDGNFPTVVSPNPEEAEALSLAVKKAYDIDADLVIGTDPDADRVGIAVRNEEEDLELLNGNQTASVLIYYILEKWKTQNRLSGNEFIAKTIVTTELLDDIAEHYKVDCPSVLTGFKWIAELIRKQEGKKEFIAGGEESYGYMIGDFVRDKDAISSAVMIAEAAAWAKSGGSSFFDKLLDIYIQFGLYQEGLVSITRKGKKGAEEIAAMMEGFRKNTPEEIGGEKVVRLLDYNSSVDKDIVSGYEVSIDLPKSNVLQFYTDKGSKITARPSGTEPKIKFYFSLKTDLENKNDYREKKAELMERIDLMKASLV